jgi:hypothetical protein
MLALGIGNPTQAAGTGYFYAYFKGGWPSGGHSGVFLSYSSDGLHFDSLNNGAAIFVPPNAWGVDSSTTDDDQARDPSVVYGPDGQFHMVWTSGIDTKTIGYASSPNLRDWTPQLIEVWDSSDVVNHTWAPEIFYNDTLEKYQIVFASDVNNGDHRLYSITTTDFGSFTDPEVFYYNGNTVIDGMIAKDAANDRYLMALKDERGGAKNISIATSADASPMSWTTDNDVVVGPGSGIENNAAEGPSLIKIGDTWHLYFDAYGSDYLGVATSTDLVTWVNRTSQSVQPVGPNAHHGTVFAAPLEGIGFELPIFRSDLNDDGAINVADWTVFIEHHLDDFAGLSAAEKAARGDLNGDGANNYLDFRIFQSDYEAFQGVGTFQAMLDTLSVPEPGASVLLMLGASTGIYGRGFGWAIVDRQSLKRWSGIRPPFTFLEK